MRETPVDIILVEIKALRAILTRMEERGDRVPFEADEKLYEIEGLVDDLKAKMRKGLPGTTGRPFVRRRHV